MTDCSRPLTSRRLVNFSKDFGESSGYYQNPHANWWTVIVSLCVLKLKSHFWVICDWFRLTNNKWGNKTTVQNKKLKPSQDLCSIFNKTAVRFKEKNNGKKQTNGTDEDSVINVDQYLFYLLRNNPLLNHGVALI